MNYTEFKDTYYSYHNNFTTKAFANYTNEVTAFRLLRLNWSLTCDEFILVMFREHSFDANSIFGQVIYQLKFLNNTLDEGDYISVVCDMIKIENVRRTKLIEVNWWT